MRRAALVLLLLLWGWPPLGASQQGDSSYARALDAYERLAEDGPEAREPSSWRRVGKLFEAAVGSAPQGQADDALYRAGIASEMAQALAPRDEGAQDRARAENLYGRLVREFPRSPLIGHALLRIGRIRESVGDTEGAKACYERVLRATPRAEAAPLAGHRLANLGKGTEVLSVRSWSGAGYTRVVLDVAGSGVFVPGYLAENREVGRPHRIYLDLPGGRRGAACTECLTVMDGLVGQVRIARFDPTTARVVLDLAGPARFRVFPLEAPSRIVVDVFRSEALREVDRTDRGPRPAEPAGPQPLKIVIDPGHGGADPGALGPRGLREKDVVLGLALELAELLRDRLRCEVKLTRSDDRFLTLEERTAIANAFGADLFISLHANASRSKGANGVETYYLERSSDRAARRLAAQENASGEAGLSEIEHILADLLLTSKVRESRRLAAALQGALVSGLSEHYGRVKSLGVKKAPFYVLTGAIMPAVLVETAFITHAEESRRLADPRYRKRTAEALVRGVEAFANGG